MVTESLDSWSKLDCNVDSSLSDYSEDDEEDLSDTDSEDEWESDPD